MDLVASETSAQSATAELGSIRRRLPFYSRFSLAHAAGVDVLSQDVSRMPGSDSPCSGFCFPPPSMEGVVLLHLHSCAARAEVLVPDDRQRWFPVLQEATVRSCCVAVRGDEHQVFRAHHQKGRVSFKLTHWGMRAVEVDFSSD